jgi:hypothetical protein
MRVVSVGEIDIGDGAGTARAFRHVLAGHLQVDAALMQMRCSTQPTLRT